MQSVDLPIKGETAGDDIVLLFNLSIDGAAFPTTGSTWAFVAELKGNQATEITNDGTITIVDDATGNASDITVNLKKADTLVPGIYNYALTRTITTGSKESTPARGVLELQAKPTPGA